MGAFLIPALAAGAQTALGIGQTIAGGAMRRKAQRFFDKNKYEIPGGVRSMLDVVKGVASQREVPGADILRQRMGATTSQGVETAQRAAQSTSDVLGALQGLYSRQMNAQQDLALAGAQNWQENQMRYANALNTLGQYETEKWQYNVMYPYMQRMSAAGQVSGAGAGNIQGGLQSGLDIYGASQQMDWMNQNQQDWLSQRGWNQPNAPLQMPAPQRPTLNTGGMKSFADYNIDQSGALNRFNPSSLPWMQNPSMLLPF